MAHVLVTEKVHDDGLAILEAAGHDVARGWEMSAADAAAALARAEGMLLRTNRIDAAAIAAAPSLKIISRHGVGCDNIDLAAAKAAGVTVAISAGANDGAVTEHTIALLLSAAKKLKAMDDVVRTDYAGGRAGHLGADLAGRRILVLGYGRIGRRVAPICRAFGMDVVLRDIALDVAEIDGFPVAASLEAGLRGAGALTVHTPLDEATRGLIGDAELALLAPGALVVNCARGGIIDEAALVRAVQSGRVGGVGSDVFSREPTTPDNPLLTLEDAALTPHTAAMTPESMRMMATVAAQNIVDYLSGELDERMIF